MKLKELLPLMKFCDFPIYIFDDNYNIHEYNNTKDSFIDLTGRFGNNDVLMISQGKEGRIEINL